MSGWLYWIVVLCLLLTKKKSPRQESLTTPLFPLSRVNSKTYQCALTCSNKAQLYLMISPTMALTPNSELQVATACAHTPASCSKCWRSWITFTRAPVINTTNHRAFLLHSSGHSQLTIETRTVANKLRCNTRMLCLQVSVYEPTHILMAGSPISTSLC